MEEIDMEICRKNVNTNEKNIKKLNLRKFIKRYLKPSLIVIKKDK